jgi:hypothetical protein
VLLFWHFDHSLVSLTQYTIQVVCFHLVAAQTSDQTLYENLRIIVNALVGAPPIYIGILAAIVIACQRMWVGVPLLVWVLTASITLALHHPLFEKHVVLLSPALAMISGYPVPLPRAPRPLRRHAGDCD